MADKKDRKPPEEKPAEEEAPAEPKGTAAKAEESGAADESEESPEPEESGEDSASGEDEGAIPATGLDADLESYPLREPGEDPRWATRIVWGWTGFALFSLAFTVVLIVLGWFYD